MTPDERNLLQQFLSDLDQSRGANKDPEADGMIADTLRRNPDAAYLLVQHAILADQALQVAQQRIQALQQQTGAPQNGSSFLGGAGGQPVQQQGWQDAQPAPQQGYPQDWRDQPAPQPQSPLGQRSGLGGFLKSAGTVAAGLAGGEFLAQGLENLFSPRDW